jgi:hypothetical protein
MPRRLFLSPAMPIDAAMPRLFLFYAAATLMLSATVFHATLMYRCCLRCRHAMPRYVILLADDAAPPPTAFAYA